MNAPAFAPERVASLQGGGYSHVARSTYRRCGSSESRLLSAGSVSRSPPGRWSITASTKRLFRVKGSLGPATRSKDPDGNILPPGAENHLREEFTDHARLLQQFGSDGANPRWWMVAHGRYGPSRCGGKSHFISRYDDVYKCMGFNVAGDEVEGFPHPASTSWRLR